MKTFILLYFGLLAVISIVTGRGNKTAGTYLFNHSHFHPTNYIQKGITTRRYIELMGTRTGRSAWFGNSRQQQWPFQNSGKYASGYYLPTDASSYYYSSADAYIVRQYKSLSRPLQDRLDPMLTGFNPADIYAAKHIERVLRTFPGVFTGIGEFSIRREFIAGRVASRPNPALHNILEFAGKAGLLVVFHNEMDMPMAKDKTERVYFEQMKQVLRCHPKTNMIWSHIGLGRIVHPAGLSSTPGSERISNPIEIMKQILGDPSLSHIYFDISWEEVARYASSSPRAIDNIARLMNCFPERFLFGTDAVAPPDPAFYMTVQEKNKPLWKALTPEASRKIRLDNYLRLFNQARKNVRAWEKNNIVDNWQTSSTSGKTQVLKTQAIRSGT